jgi:hypothetical protein
MLGGKKIHEKWLKEGKKMRPVAVFRSSDEMDDISQCAKDIMKAFKLKPTKNKGKKDLPVWIQEINDDKHYYYIIFIALSENKLFGNLNNEVNPRHILKTTNCLSDMKDVTNNKKGLAAFYKTLKNTSNNNSNNSYVNDVTELIKQIKEISANSKSWSPKGGYVKVQGGGTRKVRHYKNGNPYILLNGRKMKI